MKNIRELTNEQIFEIAKLALQEVINWDRFLGYIGKENKSELTFRIEKEIWSKDTDEQVIRVYIEGLGDTWCSIWEYKEKNTIEIDTINDKDIIATCNQAEIFRKLMEWGFIDGPNYLVEERNSIREAIDQIKNDPELFRAWKDNIAMSFKDEYWKSYEKYKTADKHETVHEIANTAAENFLNLLCK